jgi:hypothetical protein
LDLLTLYDLNNDFRAKVEKFLSNENLDELELDDVEYKLIELYKSINKKTYEKKTKCGGFTIYYYKTKLDIYLSLKEVLELKILLKELENYSIKSMII